jgi:universal stress protein A
VLFIPPEMDKDRVREQLLQVQAHDPRVRLEHRFAEGDPAAEILRATEECRCDVIVMGTHGRTGLSRLLMGSVAERVLRKAPCPVVTVKPPWPQMRPSGEQAPETASGIADE